MSGRSFWFHGPGLVAWLERSGAEVTDAAFGGRARTVRHWRRGGMASLAIADELDCSCRSIGAWLRRQGPDDRGEEGGTGFGHALAEPRAALVPRPGGEDCTRVPRGLVVEVR